MKQRYHLLDTIRGVCIILVVWYHVLFNLSEIFGGNYAFFTSDGINNFRDGFVGVLMILAGISGSLCVRRSSCDRTPFPRSTESNAAFSSSESVERIAS